MRKLALAGKLQTAHLAAMTLPITIAVALLFAGLTVLFGWLGARRPNLMRGPRMMPYRFLMLGCAAVTIMAVVHLLNLAGLHTGRGGGY